MKKKISITLLIFFIPILILSHIGWSQRENGLLFNVDGRDVDFAGIIQDKWRKTTTMCSAVSELADSNSKHNEIKKLIKLYSPPNSNDIETIHVWTSGTWAVAEVEFKDLLPAVVAIKNINKDAEIVEDAVWSGMTIPWKSGPYIRTYLRNRSNEVPEVLLNCFEFRTESFKT